MKMFAVAGRPILHSKSPLIHSNLYEQYSLQAAYSRVSADSAGELLRLAQSAGLHGLNVTSPLKQSVLPHLDAVDGEARRIGAVNTIVRRGGRLIGFNTDPAGVVRTLKHHGIDLRRKKFLILGAGGAGRAALAALRPLAAEVTVINRTWDKALSCAEMFGGRARPWRDLQSGLSETDILINTIPQASGFVPPGWLPRALTVFDAVYQDKTFSRSAAQRGCAVIPGEWWLFYQALESFSLFLGRPAPPAEMDGRLLLPPYQPRKTCNVALVGFMGSGKTAVGRLLAARSGMAFLDTDETVSQAENLSIKNIFARFGEEYFRAREKEAIGRLAGRRGTVMACGGGVVLDDGNRQTLKDNALVIWLHASLQTIASRVPGQDRPLLAGSDIRKTAGRLLGIRQPLYFKTADLIVDAGRDAGKVARNIHEEIRSTLGSQR
jgi:shikimate dehydrogenase